MSYSTLAYIVFRIKRYRYTNCCANQIYCSFAAPSDTIVPGNDFAIPGQWLVCIYAALNISVC